MCQLTLASTSSDFPYKSILSFLLVLNSEKNRDGWGFYESNSGNLYKTQEKAAEDVNLYSILKPLPNSVKFMGHVRLASVNRGLITKENAHPFDKENIILMHNGTLSAKVGKLPESITDSEHFANLLNVNYANNNYDMVKSLKDTYSKFNGKFAFLIYSKVEDKFYIVRGSTANLYKTYVKIKKGRVVKSLLLINTEKESLMGALETAKYFYSYDMKIDSLDYTPPVLLDSNKIFELENDDIKVVDTLTETVETTEITKYKPPYYGYYNSVDSLYNLGKELAKTRMSVQHLECFLSALNDTDIIQDIIHIDVEKVLAILEKYYNNRKRKVWNLILSALNTTEDAAYIITKLEFPYFLNDTKDLIKVLKECKTITS